MAEQQDKPQTNEDDKLESLPPKLTQTLSVAREQPPTTYSGNIDGIPPPFPPMLVRQKTCEDKDAYHLKSKNDELDKNFTCDTVQEEDSKLSGELPHKTLSTSSDDKLPPRRVLSSFGDTLLQKQDKK